MTSPDDAASAGPRAAAATGPGGVPWLYTAVVLGLFAAFLLSVRSVLSPFVLFLTFLYVVWPFVGTRVHARLVMAAATLGLLWVLETTGLLLVPFILALIFAYILDPLVDRLQRARIPRSLAIALLSLPALGVVALLVLVVIPAVATQVSQLLANVPGYLSAVAAWLGRVRGWVVGLGLPGITGETVPRLREIDPQAVAAYLSERQAALAGSGWHAVLGVGRGIGSVLVVLGYFVLTPILTFFLLRDWDGLRARVTDLVPALHREAAVRFATEYDALLSRYLRGQLLLSLIVGLVVGVGFWIADFPYALLIGLLAGVLNIVPYLGLVTSLAVALIVALFSGELGASLLKIVIVFGIDQIVENILQPLIVGKSVDLHPVWLLLSLALCSFFFGFVGLLLAAPAAVLVKLIAVRAVRRYRSSGYYRARAEARAVEGGLP
ncbi:MAG: AI-2E family transporter [Gemmatimonadota bacterium]